MEQPFLKIRFYGALNDFLAAPFKKKDITINYSGRQSVKDLIESLGPPHTEVWMIQIKGVNAGFDYIVQPGDRISVYPKFFNIEYPSDNKIIRDIPQYPRFIADANLGKMTKYLRLAGFDVFYRNDIGDKEIAELAYAEGFIVLSRDLGALKRKEISIGYYPRSEEPLRQAVEVINYFELKEKINPFTICMNCGGKLLHAKKEEVASRLEPRTNLYYHDFLRCAVCHNIYWEGGHWKRMQDILQKLKE